MSAENITAQARFRLIILSPERAWKIGATSELLINTRKGKPFGDGTRLETGRDCMTSLEGSTPSPSAAIETIADDDRLPFING